MLLPKAPSLSRFLAPLLIGGAIAPGCGQGEVVPSDPGRVTMRRLNRAEYNNTVHDLLGTARRPADDFPADDRGFGYDNNGDVLSLSPLVTELFVTAAESLASEALAPSTADAPNPQRARIMICDPASAGEVDCARKIITTFGRRAYRRPLAEDEITSFVGFLDVAKQQGDGFDQAIALAITQMLSSAHFLFRVERDPDPLSTEPHPLSDYELAARLSYFLWSTMPDDELSRLADQGALSDSAELARQVDRMLADAKAQALVDDFAGQWLYTRALSDISPDPVEYPQYDDDLRDSMAAETGRFFQEFLSGRASMERFLDADFAFVNQRLARHYEMPPITGSDLRRVELLGPRRGLMGHGSVLTVTSYPTRTSPVKRGKWVMEQLLCESPPPPPPGIPALPKEDMPSQSLRDELEAHRKNPSCASCHDALDPLGLAFEHFDGVGAYRHEDHGFAIDTSGVTAEGRKFTDAQGLEQIIAQDPRFFRCVGQQLYTYALGRGPEDYDQDRLDAIHASFLTSGRTLPELIRLIVLSDGFRMRRGEPVASASQP